jgi:uroporphyrinogen-III decarboxylase
MVLETNTEHDGRYVACLCGERCERTPLFLRAFTICLDYAGLRNSDVFTAEYDAEASSKAVIAFARSTDEDAVVGCVHTPAFLVEQYGGKMKYPEKGIPVPLTAPLAGRSSWDDFNPAPKGKTVSMIRSYTLVKEALPDVAVVANVTGPLTKVGVLMGMEQMSMAVLDNRGYLDEVIRKGEEATYAVLERMVSDGSVDSVFLASASDNPDLFGSDVYKEIVLPHLHDEVARVHSMGMTVAFHPHGDLNRDCLAKCTVSTGIDGLQFAENNDPAMICDAVNGRCAVMGGTDIVPTLLSNDECQIRKETSRFMDVCSGGRFVFMCSCSLQTCTPKDGIMAMVSEVRRRQLTKGL